MNSTPRIRAGAPALVLLLVLVAVVHLVWIHHDRAPPDADEVRTVTAVEKASETLTPASLRNTLRLLALDVAPHPPGLAITTLPLHRAGIRLDRLRVINVFHLLVTLVAVYAIGRRQISATAGLIMATTCAVAPVASQQAHQLLLEGPLTATVAVALCFVLESRGFSRRIPSLLFGLAIGWAMLAKWTGVAFFAGPAALALIEGVRAGRWKLGLALALLGSCVAAPWYVAHIGQVLDFMQFNEVPHAILPQWQPYATRFEGPALAFYALGLDDLLGLAVPAAVAIGLLLFVAHRRFRNRLATHALAVIVPAYATFSLLITKDPRHIGAATPALVCFGCAWICLIPWRAFRRVAVAVVLVATAAAGLVPTLGIGPAAPRAIDVGKKLAITLVEHRAGPRRADWPLDAILDAIEADRGAARTEASVLVLPNLPQVNTATFELIARHAHRPLTFVGMWDEDFNTGLLEQADYVVTTTLPPGDWRSAPIPERSQVTRWLFGEFPPGPPPQLMEILSRPLPNGLDAVVYRRAGADQARGLTSLRAVVGETSTGGPERRDGARVFTAPVPAPHESVLQLTLTLEGGKLVAALKGPPGAKYRLVRGQRRKRMALGRGVAVISDPVEVANGALDASGTGRVELPPPESGATVYYQWALDAEKLAVSNWAATTGE